MDILSVGSSTGSILEYWYLPAVLTNQDKGGFATTEPLTVNTHAGSAFWQKYWFEGMDISDPASPGKPFIDLPVKFWDEFSVNSLLGNYGNSQGYHWKMPSLNKNPQKDDSSSSESLFSNVLKANIGVVSHLGGPSFMPPRTFDREPAQAWGAPEERRHFLPSYEVDFQYIGSGLNSRPFFIFTEFLSHDRIFRQTGDRTENNYRISSVWGHQITQENSVFLLYQGRLQENLGIENGLSEGATLKDSRHNVVILFKSDASDPDKWKYHAGLGFGLAKQEDREKDIYISLKEEVIYGSPEPAQEHRTFFIDMGLSRKRLFDLTDFGNTSIGLRVPLRFELLSQSHDLKDKRIIRTDEGLPLDVFLYDPSRRQRDILFRLRPTFFSQSKLGSLKLETELGFISEGVKPESGISFFKISPTALMKFTYPIKQSRFEFIFGLQHEAIPSTLEESNFLNSNSISGKRYRWVDANDDALFQDNERVGVLYRSGGAYHDKAASLKHPVLEEAFLGGRYRFSDLWESALNISAKWYRNLYWVEYPENFNSGFVRVKRDDARGDYLYDRPPGSYGTERYILTNRDKGSFFVGIEVQILKEAITSWWFMNITLGGYTHLAHNLTGNGVNRNDIGRYSELSADPNNNIALFGRTDYDRGYLANILFGFYIWEGLTWTNTLHYRDGTPFGEFIIARGLSQGSIAVMDKERADGLRGVGRYTFYLNWDTRIRYEYKQYSVTLDVYNLLESSTETLEDPFKGKTFRRPLDSTAPRSFRFVFGYRFL